MNTFVGNIIYMAILIFAAFFIVFSFIRLIDVLRNKMPLSSVAPPIIGVVLSAAFIVWAANDFRGDKLLIKTVGSWIELFLTEPLTGQ